VLTVSTPATSKALTSLARVKAVLQILDETEDLYLGILIDQVSAFVCDYLNVAAADDGSKTLGLETLVETIMLREKRPLLQLDRAPIVAVTSIIEDDSDTALVADEDYQVIKSTGFLRRMTVESPGLWCARKIVVTYQAGWKLPDQGDDRNLPLPIETAVIDLIKNERDMRTRSAHVKVEDIPDVMRTEYFANIMNVPGAMPPETAAKLAPYVRWRP
jgi:hypothetical protein